MERRRGRYWNLRGVSLCSITPKPQHRIVPRHIPSVSQWPRGLIRKDVYSLISGATGGISACLASIRSLRLSLPVRPDVSISGMLSHLQSKQKQCCFNCWTRWLLHFGQSIGYYLLCNLYDFHLSADSPCFGYSKVLYLKSLNSPFVSV